MLAARSQVKPSAAGLLSLRSQAARWALASPGQQQGIIASFSTAKPPPGKAPTGPAGKPGAIPPPQIPPKGGAPASGGSAGGSFAKSFVLASIAGGTALTAYYYTLASKDEKASIDASLSKVKSTMGLESSPVNKSLPKPPKKEEVAAKVEEGTKEIAKVVADAVEDVKEAMDEVKEVVAEAAQEITKDIKVAVAESEAAIAHVAPSHPPPAPEPPAVEKYTPPPPSAPRPPPPADTHQEEPLFKKKIKEAEKHMSVYEDRARDIRVDTLVRATEDLAVQSAVLRKELEATLLKDLDQLDEKALRYRIIQLAAEMQERTKWEALRLHESLRQAEEETSRKYMGMLADARKETMDLLESQARALEEDKQNALRRYSYEKEEDSKRTLDTALAQQEESLKAAFQARLDEVRSEVANEGQKKTEGIVNQLQSHFKDQATARIKELEELRAKVAAMDQVFSTDSDYRNTSYKAHKVTAAVLAFEQKLMTSEPVSRELGALRKVCEGDEVIGAALSSLPNDVVAGGVPTLAELQVRFPTVVDAAREAAFVPESSQGLLGHMFASALATVTIKPKGMVPGEGTDEVLARAAFNLERGQLRSAVAELSGLKGLPAKAVRDWLADARARLLVEQAVKVVNSRSALLSSSLV